MPRDGRGCLPAAPSQIPSEPVSRYERVADLGCCRAQGLGGCSFVGRRPPGSRRLLFGAEARAPPHRRRREALLAGLGPDARKCRSSAGVVRVAVPVWWWGVLAASMAPSRGVASRHPIDCGPNRTAGTVESPADEAFVARPPRRHAPAQVGVIGRQVESGRGRARARSGSPSPRRSPSAREASRNGRSDGVGRSGAGGCLRCGRTDGSAEALTLGDGDGLHQGLPSS